MKEGDKVLCINNTPLSGNTIAPSLIVGKEYTILEIIYDGMNFPHFNVGLRSRLNYVTSYKTKQELERGNQIHWCHPSRFTLV